MAEDKFLDGYAEAEAAEELDDKAGDVQAAAEAAETAFDFEEASKEI